MHSVLEFLQELVTSHTKMWGKAKSITSSFKLLLTTSDYFETFKEAQSGRKARTN